MIQDFIIDESQVQNHNSDILMNYRFTYIYNDNMYASLLLACGSIHHHFLRSSSLMSCWIGILYALADRPEPAAQSAVVSLRASLQQLPAEVYFQYYVHSPDSKACGILFLYEVLYWCIAQVAGGGQVVRPAAGQKHIQGHKVLTCLKKRTSIAESLGTLERRE